ncbi:uncharacterized protein C6orf62 homolog isoform X1 [Pongo abelii]|uniref:uncharacterized protein C6orf62 homolog isoform X1 n=1 Tax=Pongo abelii TaxID=9601 RepID=UPI003005A1E8
MGDPNSRKKQALNRLRAQLRKKKESLADQFDFKMYIAFVFKEKKKKSALFEVSEVIPVMTNNYEENILKGVRDSSYSLESSLELLQKDVVQLHAPRYQSMRRDVIGCTQEMDFILWPRNDIEKIVCLLFSRWKESDEPFRPVQAKFEFHHGDYEKQFLHVLSRKDKTGIVVNNPNQSVFLFIDRQHLQGLTLSPGWSTLAYGSWLTAALTSWAQVIYLSFLSGWTTGMCHHIQLIFMFFVEMGFRRVAQNGLELLGSSNPPDSVSQSAGITGLSHHTQP